MIFDCHNHTNFSSDSKMLLQDALKKAKELNLGIISTEHLDLDYPVKDKFKVDLDNYIKNYTPFRNTNYLLGLELGLNETTYNKSIQLLKDKHFDFIIGSIHSIDNSDIFLTLSKSKPNKSDYYKKYFENMCRCIKLYDNFDALGHIDYICRYGSYEDNNINLNEFYPYIKESFKLLLSKGKVLELNTRRLTSKENFNNLKKIYNIYKDLGGKYVTLGSDSHRLSQIGSNFNMAYSILEALSLQPIYFKERKPEKMTL